MKLSGWARHPCVDTTLLAAYTETEARHVIAERASLIARGNGRAYGDAALNATATLDMRHLDRLVDFDPATGMLTCEAGILLSEILRHFVPRGWFPPVTPGTRFVTVGGMIAADVHGKNHHAHGSFGNHVKALTLALDDSRVVSCSRTENADLFFATIGGMGLTGCILTASFAMIPVETAWIYQETVQTASLDNAIEFFETSASWPYTMAWIDCLSKGSNLGRSVCFRGRHATKDEIQPRPPFDIPAKRTLTFPFDAPSWGINGLTVKAFNELYYHINRTGAGFIDYETFFYPLDAILEWNRMYGARGFLQYQCVLPKEATREGLPALLDRIASSHSGSFLAVLKLLGPSSGCSPLSFPREGYTLALDFPLTQGLPKLLEELDAIVAHCGGRIYLAKDARMPPKMLLSGYSDLPQFQKVCAAWNAPRKFQSLLSQRLGI